MVSDVSMTGRKSQLLEKLAKLAADTYEKEAASMEQYFARNRFIRIANGSSSGSREFPLLEGHDLREMLLHMFILRHLRGNTILETSHVNDTFDLVSLAKSLLKPE